RFTARTSRLRGYGRSVDESCGRRVGIVATVRNGLRQRLQLRVVAQEGVCQRQDLTAGPCCATFDGVGPLVRLDRVDEVVDALAGRGDELEDRDLHVAAEVAHRLIRTVAVGLVDDDEIGDLEQSGLGGLDGV